jgi:flavorubredoxin
MSTQTHYNTAISDTVRLGSKQYRIRKHDGIPYITYKRKTRVLFSNPVGGAYVNIGGSRVYFQ